MSDIKLNENVVIPLTVIQKSRNYWDSVNPIIQNKYGALCEEDQTIRIGNGSDRYSDLLPITYIGAVGLQAVVSLATEDSAGTISHIAKDEEISSGLGDGAVLTRHIPTFMNRVRSMINLSNTSRHIIGERILSHWATPRPGYKVLSGAYIEKTDSCYPIMKSYLELYPEEVITITKYTTLSTAAGGIGGVHFYAFENDDINGRIRLPDARGDYIRGYGFDGNAPLQWHKDAIRNITGYFGADYSPGHHTAPQGVFYNGWAANGRGHDANSGAVFVFDASRVVPTASENRTRTINYLPLVYVGLGEEFSVKDGQIVFNRDTESTINIFSDIQMVGPTEVEVGSTNEYIFIAKPHLADVEIEKFEVTIKGITSFVTKVNDAFKKSITFDGPPDEIVPIKILTYDTLGNVSKEVIVNVTPKGTISQPMILTPADGDMSVSRNPTITISTPVTNQQTWNGVECVVLEGTTAVYSSGQVPPQNTFVTTGITNPASTLYTIKVRVRGNSSGWTSWVTSNFTTLSGQVMAPSIITPLTDVTTSQPSILSLSDFASAGVVDTHLQTIIQYSDTPDFVTYQTITLGAVKSHTIDPAVIGLGVWYFRVRYVGNILGMSSWSQTLKMTFTQSFEQLFEASGTFTVPHTANYEVTVVGGGGRGGINQHDGAGGGGGGSFLVKETQYLTAGSSITIVVGGSDTDSKFGSLVSKAGGAGGRGDCAGGGGGGAGGYANGGYAGEMTGMGFVHEGDGQAGFSNSSYPTSGGGGGALSPDMGWPGTEKSGKGGGTLGGAADTWNSPLGGRGYGAGGSFGGGGGGGGYTIANKTPAATTNGQGNPGCVYITGL